MDLKLQEDEVALLERVLTQALGDLKMEITDTENYDMREGLKRDEEALKRIIRQLNPRAAI